MTHRFIHLHPRFAIECHEAEIVGNTLVRYRIEITAKGVLFAGDGIWHSSRALITCDIMHYEYKQATSIFVLNRPLTVTADDAITILQAAFDSLDQCAGYEDGCVLVMPIDLHDWLRRLPLGERSHAVEFALRAAAITHNAVLEN